ncbi:hypothetical protein [Tsuneonella sp. HG222]
MMDNKEMDRDAVLIAFHEECELPTRADVERWSQRHPRFAEDIREHAAIRVAMFAEADEKSAVVDDVMHARGRSRIHDALYNARREATAATGGQETFDGFASRASLSQSEVARKLGLKRVVVAALFAGRMLNPMRRFREAVADAMCMTSDQFDAAYRNAIGSPRLAGHAKAHGPPGANQQEYGDIIRSAGMADEQVRYWLEQD